MISLRLLGGAGVEIDGQPVSGPAAQRRRLALLALLASRDARTSRERLIGHLWPDTTEDRARHLLSESLYVLRKSLGEGLVSVEGDQLQLNRAALSCDLWEFEESVARGDFETAVASYAGPFLDGVYLENAPEFDQWVELERSRLERSHQRALESLADSLHAEGEQIRAREVLGRLAARDPYSGRIALKLMRLLEANGDRAAAIQHARVHAILLREELGAEPDPELAAYAEQLRGAPPTPVRASARPPIAAPLEPTGPAADDDEVPDPAPAREPAMVAGSAGAVPAPAPAEPSPTTPPFRRRRLRWHLATAGLAILLVVFVWRAAYSPSATQEDDGPGTTAIAVLPFATGVGSDPLQEHVRDGVTEELIHALSQIGDLRVTSSTSSFLFRSRGELGVREIGERLGVDVVLEGTLVRRGEEISIRTELVEVRTGFNLWSKQFDRDLQEASSFTTEIARTIAATLGHTLAPPAQVAGLGRWSDDPRALELYWIGRRHWNRRTPDGFRQAADAYQEAIARDPSFALPYAGLADIHAQVLWSGREPGEAYTSARALAREALNLAPDLAEPHATLGVVHLYYDRDWEAAERAFQRALELNPSYATAHHWYGALLALAGESFEALEMLRRAEALDPLSAAIRTSTGTALYYARRYDEAREQYRRALEIDPGFWPALAHRACASLMQGRHGEALADARQALTLSGGNPVALAIVAVAHAHAGRRDDARRVHRELHEASERGLYVSPTLLAGSHLALGEAPIAMDLLERALQMDDEVLAILRVEPLFDALRADPRFQEISERARRPNPRALSHGSSHPPPPSPEQLFTSRYNATG